MSLDRIFLILEGQGKSIEDPGEYRSWSLSQDPDSQDAPGSCLTSYQVPLLLLGVLVGLSSLCHVSVVLGIKHGTLRLQGKSSENKLKPQSQFI